MIALQQPIVKSSGDVAGSPPADAQRDAWRAALHSQGYRLTLQRQLILHAVTELGRATPEAMAGAVHRTAPAVSLSTVYRVVELLERLGLVRHVHLGHGAVTYCAVTEQPPVALRCRSCGRVQDAPLDWLAGPLRQMHDELGFQVDLGHLSLSGECRSCIATGHRPPPSAGSGTL